MLVLKPAKKGGKKLPPYTWKYIDTDKRPFVNYEAFIYAFEFPFFSLMRSATWHWARLHSVLGVQHPKSSWILERMLFVSPKLIHCQSNLPQPSPLLYCPHQQQFILLQHPINQKKKDFLFGIQNRSGVGLSFWICSNPPHQNSISVTPVA